MFNFLKKNTYKTVDIEALKKAKAYLATNPKVTFDPYPLYDGNIFTVLNSLGTDVKYMEESEKIKDKPIETMSLDNLKTMYTLILRSERFCDGAIAGYVEDGSLEKLVQREIELLE